MRKNTDDLLGRFGADFSIFVVRVHINERNGQSETQKVIINKTDFLHNYFYLFILSNLSWRVVYSYKGW